MFANVANIKVYPSNSRTTITFISTTFDNLSCTSEKKKVFPPRDQVAKIASRKYVCARYAESSSARIFPHDLCSVAQDSRDVKRHPSHRTITIRRQSVAPSSRRLIHQQNEGGVTLFKSIERLTESLRRVATSPTRFYNSEILNQVPLYATTRVSRIKRKSRVISALLETVSDPAATDVPTIANFRYARDYNCRRVVPSLSPSRNL